MDSDDQLRLVEKARGGDPAAWECLYRNAYPRLRVYAARHGGYDVAEDLVNETMSRAIAGVGRFRWESVGFDAWLFGILRRVCADHHRLRWRRPRTLARADDESDRRPGDDLELAEEHAEIRRAFERLSDAERHLLELRVIAGLSADEVSQVLGKRAGAVRTAQSRAVAHLRQLLEESR